MSPGRASEAAASTTTSISSSESAGRPARNARCCPPSHSTGTDSGACRASASCTSGAVAPEEHRGAQPGACAATSSSNCAAPFARPPATQTTCSKPRRTRVGGVRVRRLRVVDAGDAAGLRHLGDPVRGGPKPRRPSRTAAAGTPAARASAAAASAFATTLCGAAPARTSSRVAISAAELRRSSTNARSASTLVDHAEHRRRRDAEGEAHRAASLDHVGVAHELLGQRVGHVVDAGHLGARVHAALVAGVRLEDAVPVEVVGRDVEQAAARGGSEARPVQLEARELDRERRRSGSAVAAPPRRAGVPMLPDRGARRPAAASIEASIAHGRGLAVGAGDREPGRAPRRPGASARPAPPRPTPGRRAAAAPASTGCAGGQPGDVTTSSAPSRTPAVAAPGPSSTRAPSMSRMPPARAAPARRAPSTTTTDAPRSASASAAAKPETPMPGHDDAQAGPVGAAVRQRVQPRRARHSLADHPLRVEHPEAERRRRARR